MGRKWLSCHMSKPRNEPCDWEKMPVAFKKVIGDGVGDTWYVIGADLEIKGGGQEPHLAKAELYTRRARTTRVQGEDTVFIVKRDDDPLTAKGCAPKL